MPAIFISYRREDSIAYSGRLYDRLTTEFGKGQVFMDIDSIDPGSDFIEVIEQTVAACDAVLVVIGKQWLTVVDAQGRRRIENPEDFVRLEVGTALSRKVRVVPVLVGGAQMPRSDELPEALVGLTRRHALDLPDNGFHQTLERLIGSLRRNETQARKQGEPGEQGEKSEKAEQERLAREVKALEQTEQESQAGEARAREEAEQERLARETKAREQAEQERLVREAKAREQAEQERLARETKAREQAEQERLARETKAREQAEQERLARETKAREQAEQERLARETKAREQAEQERLVRETKAREQAEQERLVRETKAREQAEQERLASEAKIREHAEQERLAYEARAWEQAEHQRLAHTGKAWGGNRRWVLGAVPVLIAVLAAVVVQETRMLKPPVPPITLNCLRLNDGTFRISWNPEALRGVSHATMFVNDGDRAAASIIQLLGDNSGILRYTSKTPFVTAKLDAGGRVVSTTCPLATFKKF